MIQLKSKEYFLFMKGIAIICMIIHHAFGFPNWYIQGIEYQEIAQYSEYLRDALRICISIFVFITGGGYFLHRDKRFCYSIKKIIIFLINYWVAFFILLIPALFCGYDVQGNILILEMFGLKYTLMKFCWYVSFFISLMLILPVYSRIMTGNNLLKDFLKSIVISGVFILLNITLSTYDTYGILNNISIYFMTITSGYLCFKYDLLDLLYKKVIHNLSYGWCFIIGILLIVAVLVIHAIQPFIKGIGMGFVLIPILFISFALINPEKLKYIWDLIILLGKYSMNIWFFHCIFYATSTRTVFQPIAYFFKNPILVVIWILFVCTIAAIRITKIQKYILSKINWDYLNFKDSKNNLFKQY